MGKPFSKKEDEHLTATDLVKQPAVPEGIARGRRLIINFIDQERPELKRAEFYFDSTVLKPASIQDDDPQTGFSWSKVTAALSLFFLEYKRACLEGMGKSFYFSGANTGSLASSLGDAFEKRTNCLFVLFSYNKSDGSRAPCVDQIFTGRPERSKEGKPRRIEVNQSFLPPECVEIYWDGILLSTPDELWHLNKLIRKTSTLDPSQQPEIFTNKIVTGETEKSLSTKPPVPSEAKTTSRKKKLRQPTKREQEPAQKAPDPKKQEFSLSGYLVDEISSAVSQLRKQNTSAKSTDSPPAIFEWQLKSGPPPEPKTKPVALEGRPEIKIEPPKSPPPIDPILFEIRNPQNFTWDDDEGLVNFGADENELDLWRIRDATEGLCIMGAVGSGKTSSSSALIARAFLETGFGGVVLTAKPDEAKRWLRMCAETGRSADCIHAHAHSGHKINALQYEIQRPGDRVAVVEDLIGLFRSIVEVMSRDEVKKQTDFWSQQVDKLLRQTFELFFISGETLSVNAIARFIHSAPQRPSADWQENQFFRDIILRADTASQNGTPQDRDSFETAFLYWTEEFPRIVEVTRSGIVSGFNGMADIMNGRGIRETLCEGTNISPEMALSGKILILDYPVKSNAQGGRMVQCLFKLLFQQAIERRADKGLKTARPVFLWADESHEFVIPNDVHFQPTTRDCRASHVMISQNLHNFLHSGHTWHEMSAIFEAMNSFIFHTNGDSQTNSWASEKIGDTKTKFLGSNGVIKGFAPSDYSFFPKDPDEVKSAGSFSFQERRERAVPPEVFSKLKRGGDGTCQAIILWLSHQFAVNNYRNYCIREFEQEPRPNNQ